MLINLNLSFQCNFFFKVIQTGVKGQCRRDQWQSLPNIYQSVYSENPSGFTGPGGRISGSPGASLYGESLTLQISILSQLALKPPGVLIKTKIPKPKSSHVDGT